MIIKHTYISGCVGYCCGTDGSVWSRHSLNGRGLVDKWHRLRPPVSPTNGYANVYIAGLGTRDVHRLILETFVGPCPEGMEACHADGNRLNNRLDNLRWDTPKGNAADRAKHGTLAVGSRVGSAVLQEGNIETIGRLRSEGLTYADIAELFEVDKGTIRAAHEGRTWKHVPRFEMA
jgi:hypothetical protein